MCLTLICVFLGGIARIASYNHLFQKVIESLTLTRVCRTFRRASLSEVRHWVETPMNDSIGSRIRQIRGEESQESFAQRIGIHKNTLGSYERGVRVPDGDLLADICTTFGVSAEWLLLGKGSYEVFENAPIIPIDPAVSLVMEVEEETGKKLNSRQREAVVAILRRELDRRFGEQKKELANLISSFVGGPDG